MDATTRTLRGLCLAVALTVGIGSLTPASGQEVAAAEGAAGDPPAALASTGPAVTTAAQRARAAKVRVRLAVVKCSVRVRVDWHDRWDRRPGQHAFHVRVIAQRGDARRVVWHDNGRGPRPDVTVYRVRVSGRECRRVKRADQVVAAVTQKHDGRDRGRTYERLVTAVAARTVRSPGTRNCGSVVLRRGVNLRDCRLSGVSLRGADLAGADLRGADLAGADLRGADLRGADLRGALLGDARLGRANLRNADLAAADLAGAALRSARNCTSAKPYGIIPGCRLGGTLEPPGPMEIIEAGMQIYEAVELCEANKEAGLPCMQSTAKTVTQIHEMLEGFIKQYAIDQQRNQDALSQISYDVKNNTYDQNILALTSDFERGQTGLALYRAMTACMVAWSNQEATCPNIDAEGNRDGDQPANLASILRERDAFIASQDPAKYNVKGANDMLNRVGGLKSNATKNPYDTSRIGVLGKLVDRNRSGEKQALGLAVPDRLQVLGPDYVNRTGADVNSIINAESTYFIARGLEQQFVKRPGETGREWANAAANGGANGEMSIADQRAAYTFPGWSPTNLMMPNEGYVQRRDGTWALITTQSVSTGTSASFADLVTPEGMADLTAAIGPALAPGRIQSAYPKLLPPVTGTRPEGNAARQAARDDAAARWWTTPQATTDSVFNYNDASRSRELTLVGSNLRGHQMRLGHPSHWKTRPATSGVTQRSLPYSIFATPTDTVRGTGDAYLYVGRSTYDQYCGNSVTSSRPWTCIKDQVNAHSDPVNLRGITGYQAPTWDWVLNTEQQSSGPGLIVRYRDIEGSTVTTDPVTAVGLLVGAA